MRRFELEMVVLGVALWMAPAALLAASFDLGTEFAYQGRLEHEGGPAQGTYDFDVELWDSRDGGELLGTLTLFDRRVIGGVFTLDMDFGDVVREVDETWLAIRVREAGPGSFTELEPRQRIATATTACVVSGDLAVTGALGVGSSSASSNAKLHVQGQENDGGSSAALKVTAGTGLGVENLLVDGNEIDAFGVFGGYNLFLNGNSDGDVVLAQGGGSVITPGSLSIGSKADVAGVLEVGSGLILDGVLDFGLEKVTSSACTSGSVQATCPAGKMVLGGGCSGGSTHVMSASGPVGPSNSFSMWDCRFSPSDCNGELYAWAVCARAD